MKRLLRLASHEWFLLALVTGLAAVLRLALLDRLPPGLYHDEAYNGLDALGVLRGETPLFFPANNGREPLFIYLQALAVALLGPTPGALRVVSALLGTLLVPATYLLGRTWYDRRVGALAATLAATTVWTLNLSRVALRAVAAGPLLALALAALWRGLSARRAGWLVAGGVAYGLAFYTYLAVRFTPLALAAFLMYLALWRRRETWWRGWLLFGGVAALVAAPLGAYLLAHGELLGRAGQVSVFNPAIGGAAPWRTLLGNAARAVLGLVWRGDFIPRHNVPLRPAFDPLTSLALVGGVLVGLRGWRRRPADALALLWVGVMLLPTVLAEDAPHFLRASGVLPVLFLLPARGLGALWARLARAGRGTLGALAALGVLLYGGLQGGLAYYAHLRSEAAFYQFEAGAVELAAEVNRHLGSGWQGVGLAAPAPAPAASRLAYLAPRLWENWASVRYLCAGAWERGDLTTDPARLAEAGGDVLLGLWPFEPPAVDLAALPEGRLVSVREGAWERGDLEPEARPLYVTLTTDDPTLAPRNVERAFAGGLTLQGYALAPLADGRLAVDLYWRATTAPGEAYNVFVHLLDGGILVAQHDGPAALGVYGTERWRAGDLVLDRHVLPAPAGETPLGGAQLRLGLYVWPSMEHLALLTADGRPSDQEALLLTP